MTLRRAEVRLSGRFAGYLEELEGGETRFAYDRSWLEEAEAPPIALTLPKRAEPFRQKGLHPYFENLLPEGWLLDFSTMSLKISKDDAFGLLLALCGDCIGAVEIFPIGERK